MVLSVLDGFDLLRPAGAAGPLSRAGCSSATRTGSSRLPREGVFAKLSMTVNRTVGVALGRPVLPAGCRHGVRLHATAPGNSDPQRPHGITLPAFGTALASFRESPGAAWTRPCAPGLRLSPAACALPEPARPAGPALASRARRDPCCRSSVASVRSAAGLALCPVPPPDGVTGACDRIPATGRSAGRRAFIRAVECVEGKAADRHRHSVLQCSHHAAEPDQVGAAVLIPVPNALDLRLRIRLLPVPPAVRVRTREAAFGAGEGRSALEPDGVSERDRDHLAVRPRVHGGVLLPDRIADSLQEGALAVAAASEPDSLQMTLSRGVRLASYFVAVAAPSNPSSWTGIRGTAGEVGGPDRMDALRAVGSGHSPPCVQGVLTLAGAVSTTWRPMRTVS